MKKQTVIPDHKIFIENHAHKADFKTSLHKHSYHSLLFVVSGKGECKLNNKLHSLTPNSVIILKESQLHQLIDTPDNAMTIFVIYFHAPLSGISDKTLDNVFRNDPTISIPPFSIPKFRRLLRQMLYEQENKPLLYNESIQQCLSVILLELYRIQLKTEASPTHTLRKGEQKTAMVLEYTEQNLYEHHTLASSAKMAGISQRQFTTLCNKLTGNSFNQYINKLRTKQAAELLKKGESSVTAIAFEVGYEDLSTFYRAFKRFYHTSPLNFCNKK